MAAEASSREVLQIIESDVDPSDPPNMRRSRSSRRQRVSRRIHPSGWDTFEATFLTRSDTRSLQVHLLHQNGESEEAVTRYDDLVVEQTRCTDFELYQELRERYAPRDGDEGRAPWRLRVALSSPEGKRSEVRDCALLPPQASMRVPVALPEAEIRPRLRFQYGMAREAHSVEGDGAVVDVGFEDESGEAFELASLELDPKNDREQRVWLEALVDLSPVAGRRGALVLACSDVPGSEPDALDAVVIATPRIEPADQEPTALNVLLIGVDTLRADRMSAFGYERDTTPHLKALADAGIRFPKTRTQAPWTLPSFASITTSMYPSAHGAGRGGHDEWTPIDPSTVSLAEVLSRVGYETRGIVANGLISPKYGLDQGYEAYQSAFMMESAENDAEVVAGYVERQTATPVAPVLAHHGPAPAVLDRRRVPRGVHAGRLRRSVSPEGVRPTFRSTCSTPGPAGAGSPTRDRRRHRT